MYVLEARDLNTQKLLFMQYSQQFIKNEKMMIFYYLNIERIYKGIFCVYFYSACVAAEHGQTEVLRVLIENGANIND